MAELLGPFSTSGAAVGAALDELRRRVGLEAWLVLRVDGPGLTVLEVTGDVVERGDRVCLEPPLPAWRRVVRQDARLHVGLAGDHGHRLLARSVVSLPLADEEGEPYALLVGVSAEPGQAVFGDDVELVELVGRLVATALAHEHAASLETRRADRAMLDALLDPLTGVYNRRAWDRLLDEEDFRASVTGSDVSVLSIDLDDLKVVNDTQGHAAGDDLLVRAAQTLQRAVRGGDAVARLGGDEFGVLAVDCAERCAGELGLRLAGALLRHGIRASLGMASRAQYPTLLETWRAADEAMYRDKRRRKPQRHDDGPLPLAI